MKSPARSTALDQYRRRPVASAAHPTILQRTLQLARSGKYRGVPEIRVRLKAEGYVGVGARLCARGLVAELTAICDEAHRNKE
jgi:hypothetical protein